ncbi:uncharacterized protein [Aristolochia californica]|uniref:uncharacterized protein n=1 Tax=Aristolochia californica TaxID=171875 RepID=UPI0035E0D62B
MERHLQRNVSLENQRPSCVWGILHLFDFHRRLNVRQMLPDGKDSGGKHDGGIKFSKKKLVSDPGETQELMDPEADCSCNQKVEEYHKSKTKKQSKKSVLSRIKVLIEKEMAKERGKRRINPALAPRLQRLYSIHHLEGGDFDLPEEGPSHGQDTFETEPSLQDGNASKSCDNEPIELQNNFCRRCEACGILNSPAKENNNLSELGRQLLEKQAHLRDMLEEVKKTLSNRSLSDKVAGEVGIPKSQEILDVVEAFNNNQELFVKMLEDKGSVLPNHIQGSSGAGAVLNNSGLIPGARLSGRENMDHVNLKHKELNTGSAVNGRGKPISGSRHPESVAAGSLEATQGESTPFRTDERAEAGAEGSDSPHLSKKSRLKSIKRKIAHAIKGSKKERHPVALDGILHKIPYGHDVSEELKSATERKSGDSPSSSISNGSGQLRMKRSTSLSGSLDRYSQLFDSSFQKEPTINRARTLKLTNSRNEDTNSLESKPEKSFGRVRSLPSFHSFQLESDVENEETRQMLSRWMPPPLVVGKLADLGSNSQGMHAGECSRLSWFIESEINGENFASGPISRASEQLFSDTDVKREGLDRCKSNEFLGMIMKDTNKKAPEPSPISVLNSCFQEDVSFPENSSVAEEGSDLKPGRTPFSEVEAPTVALRDEPEVKEAEDVVPAVDELTSPLELIDSESLLYQFDEREEPEFKYVTEILRRSRFTGSKLLGSWYDAEQPLDPSLFDEVGSQQIQYDASGKVASLEAYLEHLLLFDLLNEVLLEIYERSYTLLPRSALCPSISRPMPTGYRVLEEVWAMVSWHLNFQPQADTLVEYVVACDLHKYDSWMNIQFDLESLALELEDWILDDLLDEVAFELLA